MFPEDLAARGQFSSTLNLPRHDANSPREELQHGNVSSRNYYALRLLADIVHLVSNRVLAGRTSYLTSSVIVWCLTKLGYDLCLGSCFKFVHVSLGPLYVTICLLTSVLVFPTFLGRDAVILPDVLVSEGYLPFFNALRIPTLGFMLSFPRNLKGVRQVFPL